MTKVSTKNYVRDVKVSRTQSDQLKFKQNILVLFIITINFLLDRISKILIINFFSSGQNEYYINPFLNFILIWNKGIAFGFFDSENLTYHMISLAIFISFFLSGPLPTIINGRSSWLNALTNKSILLFGTNLDTLK